jgi:hypothetical protein
MSDEPNANSPDKRMWYVVLGNERTDGRLAHDKRRGVCRVPPIKLICELSLRLVPYWLRYDGRDI